MRQNQEAPKSLLVLLHLYRCFCHLLLVLPAAALGTSLIGIKAMADHFTRTGRLAEHTETTDVAVVCLFRSGLSGALAKTHHKSTFWPSPEE